MSLTPVDRLRESRYRRQEHTRRIQGLSTLDERNFFEICRIRKGRQVCQEEYYGGSSTISNEAQTNSFRKSYCRLVTCKSLIGVNEYEIDAFGNYEHKLSQFKWSAPSRLKRK